MEFAQCSHIGLLLAYGAANPSELLGLHSSIPRGPLQIGVIVDDLVVLETVLRDTITSDPNWFAHSESAARVDAACLAYASEKLVTNPKKAFKGQLAPRFWGIELDGDKGLLRCSSLRLWPRMA